MSLINEIDKMIKENNDYLYYRIIDFLDENSTDFFVEVKNKMKQGEKSLGEKIISYMEAFIEDNNIELNNFDSKTPIEKYFSSIINFLEENKQKLKKFHAKILYNLLKSKTGRKIIDNNQKENKKETKFFSISDFIINYTELAIEILFKKTCDKNNADKLNDIYLYFIFQIKDLKPLRKLKILVYEYLYEKKDISNFIDFSSEQITIQEPNDFYKLKKLETEHNEIDLKFNKVSDGIKSFFGKKLERKKLDLLRFFTSKTMKENKIYTKDVKLESEEEQIAIDELKYDKKKIHLFSTEFLITNGLKLNIKESDFEIFNDDNYSIDLYSKFLLKIIDQINNSMNKNNFENDFMDKHLIKLHTNNFFHFISAKLDYDDKIDLNEIKEQNIIKNPFIKIKMFQNKNLDINQKENKNNIKRIEDKISYSATTYSDEAKNKSDDFEKLINNLLTDNIDKNELILLPNILFMLNLKIPRFDIKNNTINFKSAYLDYFNKDTNFDNDNFCYGFKEIDAVFKSNSKKFIDVNSFQFFQKNLIYIKEERKNYFKLSSIENKFSIYPNSVFFCEIKYKFPDLSAGTQTSIPVVIKNKSDNKGKLSPYEVQLKKLIKKFIFFYDLYKKKINPANIQLVFLYDFINLNRLGKNDEIIEKIKNETQKMLNKYKNQLKDFGKIIFQLIYFDYTKHNLELHETIKEKDKTILDKDNVIKKKDETILDKDNVIKKKDETILDKDNIIKEKNNTILDKDNIINEKNNTILNKDNIINKKDSELKEKDNIIKQKDKEIISMKNVIGNIMKDDNNLNVEQIRAMLKNLYNNIK